MVGAVTTVGQLKCQTTHMVYQLVYRQAIVNVKHVGINVVLDVSFARIKIITVSLDMVLHLVCIVEELQIIMQIWVAWVLGVYNIVRV